MNLANVAAALLDELFILSFSDDGRGLNGVFDAGVAGDFDFCTLLFVCCGVATDRFRFFEGFKTKK